mmetsp:Transcript_5812/g.16483  ORF Transcript_5812/g.16483 Transcript_5812/m.16483 type:complete len:201 (-) Transcript_5812:2282-2884(-)
MRCRLCVCACMCDVRINFPIHTHTHSCLSSRCTLIRPTNLPYLISHIHRETPITAARQTDRQTAVHRSARETNAPTHTTCHTQTHTHRCTTQISFSRPCHADHLPHTHRQHPPQTTHTQTHAHTASPSEERQIWPGRVVYRPSNPTAAAGQRKLPPCPTKTSKPTKSISSRLSPCGCVYVYVCVLYVRIYLSIHLSSPRF